MDNDVSVESSNDSSIGNLPSAEADPNFSGGHSTRESEVGKSFNKPLEYAGDAKPHVEDGRRMGAREIQPDGIVSSGYKVQGSALKQVPVVVKHYIKMMVAKKLYIMQAGTTYKVPENVKEILKQRGLLEAL